MSLSISTLDPQPTKPVASAWRRINTPIPVPESVPLIERLRAVEPRSMAAMPPVVWHEAEGFLVRDRYGNQWIDLTSGIVMASAGHAHPKIVDTIHAAADRKLLATYAFASEARLMLLEKLVALSPVSDAKAILFSAGTEATEAAMMLMRRHGRQIDSAKSGILSFENGYHGRTLAAVMASGSPQPGDWIDRTVAGHFQIPFPFGPVCPWGHGQSRACDAGCFQQSIEALEQRGVRPDMIAGFIGEAVPGWTTKPIPPGYATALRAWADEHDILICFDEVQCGCGRTGKMFGFEHTGTVPDLFALGKGMSSSLPVSAVVGRREVMDLAAPGDMSSTHGGNPLCTQVALACLNALDEEGLVEASNRTGRKVLEALLEIQREFPQRFVSIHGPGLFISAHLKDPGTGQADVPFADAVASEAVRRGVLMFVTGRGYLKFTPPLVIEPEAALEAVDVIHDCVRDLA